MKAVLSTVIRSKRNPSSFVQIGKVTRDELSDALEQQKSQRVNALSGRTIASSEENNIEKSRAQLLLQSVRVAQRHVWGSSGERLVYRRRAFSMDAFLKSAAVFVTITPSDVGTLAISILSGKMSYLDAENLTADQVPPHT